MLESSCSEVVTAIMTIKNLLFAGKPFLALPYVSLAGSFFDNRHPPIPHEKNTQADAPFKHNPNYIVHTK